MATGTAYKLVPADMFKDLFSQLVEGQSVRTADDNQDDGDADRNQQQQQQQQQQQISKPHRSVGEIQRKFIESYAKNSDASEKAEQFHAKMTGGQLEQQPPSSHLTWVHNDPGKLPQYTQQNRLQGSFKNYSDLLHSEDIPLELKIPLMQYYRQRYENSKHERGPSQNTKGVVNNGEDDDDDDDDDNVGSKDGAYSDAAPSGTHYGFQAERGVEHTLSNVTRAKRKDAKKLLKALSKLVNDIRWDHRGMIVKPAPTRNSSIVDLKQLINISLYTTRGNAKEITDVSKILLPVYNRVQKLILNKKLVAYMNNIALQETFEPPGKKFKYETLY